MELYSLSETRFSKRVEIRNLDIFILTFEETISRVWLKRIKMRQIFLKNATCFSHSPLLDLVTMTLFTKSSVQVLTKANIKIKWFTQNFLQNQVTISDYKCYRIQTTGKIQENV